MAYLRVAVTLTGTIPPPARQAMAAPGALSLEEKIKKVEEKIEKKEEEEEEAKQKLKELEEGSSE